MQEREEVMRLGSVGKEVDEGKVDEGKKEGEGDCILSGLLCTHTEHAGKVLGWPPTTFFKPVEGWLLACGR
jgi:hypothetical protein